jgi:hypothetical protein
MVVILLECPRYGWERQTYHLHGTLRDILGDGRRSVYNIMVF